MRNLPKVPLALLCACACACACAPSSQPPAATGADAGRPVDEAVFSFAGLALSRGGSGFGIAQATGAEAITGLRVEAPEYLTLTLESDRIEPGRSILVRADSAADAPAGLEVAQVILKGSSGGREIWAEGAVEIADDPGGRALEVWVQPQTLEVPAGATGTAKVILNPRSAATKGTVHLASLQALFDTPSVEVDGLRPVEVAMRVRPYVGGKEEVEWAVEAFLGREISSGTFTMVLGPGQAERAALRSIAGRELHVQAGQSVSLHFSGSTNQTAWEVLDLPAGVDAALSEDEISFATAPDLAAGAHRFRIRGTRDGVPEDFWHRLLVPRTTGDWPQLGGVIESYDHFSGGRNAGWPQLAFDAAGVPHLACASRPHAEASSDFRAWRDGRWERERSLDDCSRPSFESTGEGFCFADLVRPYLRAACAGEPKLLEEERLPGNFRGYALKRDVLAADGEDGSANLLRWSADDPSTFADEGGWRAIAATATAGVLDVAPAGESAILLAVRRPSSQEGAPLAGIEVRRHDGTAWATLGNPGAQLALASDTSVFPYLDVQNLVSLEAAPDGSPVLAWLDSADESIHLSRWNGTAWQALAAPLPPRDGFLVYELQLRLDPAGTPVIAWLEAGFPTSEWASGFMTQRPSHLRVHRAGAAGWEELSATPLNLDPDGPVRSLSLALDPTGRAHLAWVEGGAVLVARSAR